MERGKIQVLFHFLPDKTFDWEKGKAICKVTRIEGEENKKLSKRYILQEVKRLVSQWDKELVRYFPKFTDEDSYVLIDPETVKAEVFPLVFECQKCRRLTHFFDERDFKNRGSGSCRHCGGMFIQLHHVLVHECGEIAPLSIPSCPRHGKEHIMLDDRGSQTYSNFRWVCRACNDRPLSAPLYRACGCNYKLKSKQMRPMVHRASTGYIPWNITVVNIPNNDMNTLMKDDKHPELLVAAYLGMFNHPERSLLKLTEDGDTSGGAKGMDIEKMLLDVPEHMRDLFRAQLINMKKVANETGNNERDRLINSVHELIDDSSMNNAVKELIERVYSREYYETITLDKLSQQIVERYPKELPKIQKYRKEMEHYGIHEVELIENFPIANVMVGYTRLEREPGQSVLRSFPMLKGKQPLYVHELNTEAVLFSLDPISLLKWLESNHIITYTGEQRDERSLKAWFLKNIQEIDRFGNVNSNNPINHLVTGLLHTMSHLLIRQAATACGFDRGSMSEYLFPRTLSFAIYANSQQAATMGGLHSMFEQFLDQWLRGAYIEGSKCIYDPVCHEHESACHSCLFLAETSCRHANRVLSRNLLYGGITEFPSEDGTIQEHQIIGYWEI